MRLAVVSLALVLAIPRPASGQTTYGTGDTLSPRVKVGSCQVADSLLGQATNNVMKAEVHGSLVSSTDYRLASGPVSYRNRLPASLQLFPGVAEPGQIPGGILMMWIQAEVTRLEGKAPQP